MAIEIKAKVVGVRIYTNQGRHVTLEYEDDPNNQFPIHHTIEVKDHNQLELGDEVSITIMKHYSYKEATN